jgi:hypothetical protein
LATSALCSSVKAMKDLLVISTLNVIQIRGTPSVKLKPTAKFMACLRDPLPPLWHVEFSFGNLR